MIADVPFIRDVRGSMALAWYCLGRIHVLRRDPFRYRFLQLLLEAGSKGLGDAGIRAVVVGTLMIAFMIRGMSGNSEFAIRLLVIFVVREFGPLLAAILVLVRVGTALSAQLSVMNLRGELRALRLLGVPSWDYLAVPAVFALAVATAILSFYFQITAVAGGVVVSGWLLDLPIREMIEHLLALLTPRDVAYTLFKSFGFGLIIAIVNVYYGLQASSNVSENVSRSIVQSLFAMLVFNALAAWCVYG